MRDGPIGPSVIRAVGFDLDDTLAVTEQPRERLLDRAVEDAGVDATFDREDYVEAHRQHSGSESRRPIFEALLDGGEAAELTRAYRRAVGEAIRPVGGATSAVAALRGRYRVGLLTDGPGGSQRDKLRRLGWADAFDTIVVTGTIGTPKPDPEAFATLAEALGVRAEEVAYVGDNPVRDVAGAAAVGMRPIQVVYDGGPDPHPDAASTVTRTDLTSLPGVLEHLGCDGSNDA